MNSEHASFHANDSICEVEKDLGKHFAHATGAGTTVRPTMVGE
jgi:hypothetical protein